MKKRKNEKVWIGELTNSKILEQLGFNTDKPVKMLFDGDALRHIEKRHGVEAPMVKDRGQPAVELEDIKNYPEIVNNADLMKVENTSMGKRLVIGKQINGYMAVVEVIGTKNNQLTLKMMYKENGKLENAKEFKESISNHNVADSRPLHTGDSLDTAMDATNPTTQEVKSQETPKVEDPQVKVLRQTVINDLGGNAYKPLKSAILPKEELFKQLKGYAHFGKDFIKYRDKGLEVLKYVAKKRQGQVSGAYYRQDLGAIDIGYALPVKGTEGLKSVLAGQWSQRMDAENNIYYWGQALRAFEGEKDSERILHAVDRIIREGTYSFEDKHHILNLELENGLYKLELFPISLDQPSHFFPIGIQYHHKPKPTDTNNPMERE
ncbi:hypothetical protein NHP21011_03420 [Helicobacter heilmannii]|uniref:PBECR3 domain-containing polyvalent protein n=1 Tax=Helicobacter heilmannii TaxID=35817 RepID=UPI00244D8543|nr:hypothetical protein [Helicobacter heilmannii]GMB94251.1 hypothetical protein NHP21011_03420 [Helicobacter heilmannii]